MLRFIHSKPPPSSVAPWPGSCCSHPPRHVEICITSQQPRQGWNMVSMQEKWWLQYHVIRVYPMKNDGLMGFFSIFKQTFLGRAKKNCVPSLLDVCVFRDNSKLAWMAFRKNLRKTWISLCQCTGCPVALIPWWWPLIPNHYYCKYKRCKKIGSNHWESSSKKKTALLVIIKSTSWVQLHSTKVVKWDHYHNIS